jgi:hypothetical protein
MFILQQTRNWEDILVPKTYASSKKEKWLTQLALGKSPRQVAKASSCDVRTVKRAVLETRTKSAAQEALLELYREALRNHMNGMNVALDGVIEELRLPEVYLPDIAWSQIKSPLSQYDRKDSEEWSKISESGDDPFSDRALLAEHLRNSKAWRSLANWQRSYLKHRLACGRLQITVLAELADTTGVKASLKGDTAFTPFLYAEQSGDLICRAVTQYLLTKEDTASLEKQIVINQEGNAVQYRTTLLAEGFTNPQQAAECRTKILESLEILKTCPEAQQVLITYHQLEKTFPKTRNELRAIRLLGILPSQCRICRQFGL